LSDLVIKLIARATVPTTLVLRVGHFDLSRHALLTQAVKRTSRIVIPDNKVHILEPKITLFFIAPLFVKKILLNYQVDNIFMVVSPNILPIV